MILIFFQFGYVINLVMYIFTFIIMYLQFQNMYHRLYFTSMIRNVYVPLFLSTVADDVDEVYAIPFGVTCIGINWTDPVFLNSRGDSLSFFVGVTETSSGNNFTVNNGENNEKIFMNLRPEELYDFEVWAKCMCFSHIKF